MTSLCAIVPAQHLIATNAALEAQGFGPANFSVQCFPAAGASHAALHAWHDPAFTAAVTALPNVAYDIGEGDPITRTRALIEAQGAQWGDNAPEYGGTLTAGTGCMQRSRPASRFCLLVCSRDRFPSVRAVGVDRCAAGCGRGGVSGGRMTTIPINPMQFPQAPQGAFFMGA